MEHRVIYIASGGRLALNWRLGLSCGGARTADTTMYSPLFGETSRYLARQTGGQYCPDDHCPDDHCPDDHCPDGQYRWSVQVVSTGGQYRWSVQVVSTVQMTTVQMVSPDGQYRWSVMSR